MTIKQRIVLRWLGITVSDEGTRWTAPRKRKPLVERAFARVRDDAWRQGIDVRLQYVTGGMEIVGLERTITLRWRD